MRDRPSSQDLLSVLASPRFPGRHTDRMTENDRPPEDTAQDDGLMRCKEPGCDNTKFIQYQVPEVNLIRRPWNANPANPGKRRVTSHYQCDDGHRFTHTIEEWDV